MPEHYPEGRTYWWPRQGQKLPEYRPWECWKLAFLLLWNSLFPLGSPWPGHRSELCCISQCSVWTEFQRYLSVFQDPREQPHGAQLFCVKWYSHEWGQKGPRKASWGVSWYFKGLCFIALAIFYSIKQFHGTLYQARDGIQTIFSPERWQILDIKHHTGLGDQYQSSSHLPWAFQLTRPGLPSQICSPIRALLQPLGKLLPQCLGKSTSSLVTTWARLTCSLTLLLSFILSLLSSFFPFLFRQSSSSSSQGNYPEMLTTNRIA